MTFYKVQPITDFTIFTTPPTGRAGEIPMLNGRSTGQRERTLTQTATTGDRTAWDLVEKAGRVLGLDS